MFLNLTSNKIFIISPLLLSFSCNNPIQNFYTKSGKDSLSKDKIYSLEAKDNKQINSDVLPDIRLNNKFELINENSTKFFYPDYGNISLVEGIRQSSVALFCNYNKSEYLFAYHYEGDTKLNFSVFEFGLFDTNVKKYNFNLTSENYFFTESGLKLGMSLKDIVKIKGEGLITKTTSDTIVTYSIKNSDKSEFLRKNKEAGYFIECTIKNAKTVLIKFGFEYP